MLAHNNCKGSHKRTFRMDVCEVNEGTVAIRGFGWRSKRRYRRERHLRFSSPLRSSSDPAYAIFLELKLSEDVRSLAEQGWRSVLQIQQESRHLGHPTRLRASLSLLRTTLHFWTGNSRRVATNEKKKSCCRPGRWRDLENLRACAQWDRWTTKSYICFMIR